MNGIKLICLPYAGGSAAIYTRWNNLLDSSIKLYPFELAGRGAKHNIPYYDSFQEAVDDIAFLIEDQCTQSEYAVWGHSMGSILAYELICSLQEKGIKLPVHVFFSGRYPPSVKKEDRMLHILPEDEFEREALKLGGIPEKLTRIKGLLRASLQTLRADYKLLETYSPSELKHKFDFNISVLAGNDDELASPVDMEKWKAYCGKECAFYYFDGGHFYLNKHAENITRIINETLCKKEGAYGR